MCHEWKKKERKKKVLIFFFINEGRAMETKKSLHRLNFRSTKIDQISNWLLNWKFEVIKKDLLYKFSFQDVREQLKTLLSNEREKFPPVSSNWFQIFTYVSFAYVSFKSPKENKKIIEFSYFSSKSKKEERREERIFKIFKKREREKRDNYYQPQKKRSKTKKKTWGDGSQSS